MGVTCICDFDGTISLGEFPIVLLDSFCKADWRELDREFRQGKMSLNELIETEVRNLDISREGLAEFAKKTIHFRMGFWEFYHELQEKGIKFVIVSEGLKEYIQPFFGPSAEIYANECEEDQDGTLHLRTPFSSETCTDCGNCKKEIVLSFIRSLDFVFYIGDGESDFCAAEHAHMRFARGPLAKHLEEKHLEFLLFDDFKDVLEIVERMG
jgi:2,3-diketo-5-methylthio-1-phosphopentane phosphatase